MPDKISLIPEPLPILEAIKEYQKLFINSKKQLKIVEYFWGNTQSLKTLASENEQLDRLAKLAPPIKPGKI